MGAKPVFAVSPVISMPDVSDMSALCTSFSMLIIDVMALSCLYWIAVIGRHLITPGNFRFYVELFPGIVLFVLAFSIQGLYPGVLLHPAEEIRRIFHCVSIVLLLVLCTTFLWHNAQSYSRSIVMIIWALATPAVLLARWIGRTLLARSGWWGVPAVVFGSGLAAQRVARTLKNRHLGVRVTAVIENTAASLPPSSAHYAIIATTERPEMGLQRMIQDCCKGFRHVLLVPDLPGVCSLGITAREIGGEVGLEVPQRLFHRSARIAKRSLDLLLALPILLTLIPIFVLIAIAIKLTSRGPVFYCHTRYGHNGRTFKALKFRTMVQNGDSVLKEHFQKYPADLTAWQCNQKLRRDPRVTKIGNFLRRYSLDELPQVINVLLGEMSLVGPRPIVASEIEKYGRGYGLYTRVRPGITGLWQVSGRNNTTYQERVGFDEYYVRNWSIWLDTYILIRTVKAVIRAEGAY